MNGGEDGRGNLGDDDKIVGSRMVRGLASFHSCMLALAKAKTRKNLMNLAIFCALCMKQGATIVIEIPEIRSQHRADSRIKSSCWLITDLPTTDLIYNTEGAHTSLCKL